MLLYTRHEDHWDFREVKGLDSVFALPSVEVTLSLADIYALIEFEAHP